MTCQAKGAAMVVADEHEAVPRLVVWIVAGIALDTAVGQKHGALRQNRGDGPKPAVELRILHTHRVVASTVTGAEQAGVELAHKSITQDTRDGIAGDGPVVAPDTDQRSVSGSGSAIIGDAETPCDVGPGVPEGDRSWGDDIFRRVAGGTAIAAGPFLPAEVVLGTLDPAERHRAERGCNETDQSKQGFGRVSRSAVHRRSLVATVIDIHRPNPLENRLSGKAVLGAPALA